MQAGTLVDGKYRVERRLGEGGMATVYEATRVQLNERVALKVLLANLAGDAVVVERFMREAKAAARLKSEHVVLILDVGALPSKQPYIVMEFLDGTDLEGTLRERGRIPLPEAIDYILQIGEALAEAHSLGIVHRDIKPANCIVVQRRNGGPLVKVLDFGIAKLTLGDGPNLTGTQATMGTPAFMSPEQIRGAKDVDHRADIWSLGITLFQLATGNLPFGGNTYARLVMSVSREPTPQLPNHPELNAVLQRALAKDRNERYSTIGEFMAALEPFAGDRAAASSLVRRAMALAPAQRIGPAAAPAAGAQAPMQRTTTLPMGGSAPMTTPAHGAPPMITPAHGAPPMITPAHGAPPMITPAHGAPPMITPAHGAPPMITPAHGAPPMVTPPHGAPPMPAPAAPARRGSALVFAIVAGVVVAGVVIALVLLR